MFVGPLRTVMALEYSVSEITVVIAPGVNCYTPFWSSWETRHHRYQHRRNFWRFQERSMHWKISKITSVCFRPPKQWCWTVSFLSLDHGKCRIRGSRDDLSFFIIQMPHLIFTYASLMAYYRKGFTEIGNYTPHPEGMNFYHGERFSGPHGKTTKVMMKSLTNNQGSYLVEAILTSA